MTLPQTSVIVVSRGRADHLRLCLLSLSMQDHPDFEVVLVADAAGLAQRMDLPLKRVTFDVPNISLARNLGLAHAAGAVVAFIDDDSVAEPRWLSRLVAPFDDPSVMAATGWTRARDGFSWQTRTDRIDARGLPLSEPNPARETRLLGAEAGTVPSTLGTNCAFRTVALRRIGGFDPAFSYHLDESDVNMRMAAAMPDALTAVVPSAQVIHAQAGNAGRDKAAVPLDLSVQGRSAAIFARRYAGKVPEAEIIARYRRRLIRQVLDAKLDPFRVGAILESLRSGLAEGGDMAPPAPPPPGIETASAGFRRMPVLHRPGPVLGGWHWQAATLRAQASDMAKDHLIPTIVLLSPSFLPHRLRLTEAGWFEQTGGLWGQSEPGDSPLATWRLRDRIAHEANLATNRRN
ncbi:glycosyltransferase family 2 protein [Paracoccus aurantiacus]|uniref:Glycosyltransferase family 2 protein n=1 Tax=Paracoccus aurantiacus TaxID=2599412 RepID=A0A5C6S2B2_9RHOB|nr:glycosyltransferase family A protein [Paracoccus aurantiacus]TXB68069.1 glycosyltransferase family 2 protein [Paracoccus aurantiacus]